MLRLRDQLTHLRDFAGQVASGAQRVDGRFRQRVKLYVNSARAVYHETARKVQQVRGLTEERRILGAAEHCPDCIGYAAQEWQPIGTLPVPGVGSVCRAFCHCSMDYR